MQDNCSRAARSAVHRENSKWWTKIHTRLTWVSQMKKVIEQFYWLITFFGFNWGQSHLATLVTRQNCTIMLRNLILFYILHILSSEQKKFLVLQATFEQLSLQYATFDCFLSNFLATVWEVTGNFLCYKTLSKTRTVQMALVGPRSNVVSPHGIVVDRSSRPDVTDIKIIDYGEVLETFIWVIK